VFASRNEYRIHLFFEITTENILVPGGFPEDSKYHYVQAIADSLVRYRPLSGDNSRTRALLPEVLSKDPCCFAAGTPPLPHQATSPTRRPDLARPSTTHHDQTHINLTRLLLVGKNNHGHCDVPNTGHLLRRLDSLSTKPHSMLSSHSMLPTPGVLRVWRHNKKVRRMVRGQAPRYAR
jgi:hypothetical protein